MSINRLTLFTSQSLGRVLQKTMDLNLTELASAWPFLWDWIGKGRVLCTINPCSRKFWKVWGKLIISAFELMSVFLFLRLNRLEKDNMGWVEQGLEQDKKWDRMAHRKYVQFHEINFFPLHFLYMNSMSMGFDSPSRAAQLKNQPHLKITFMN